ncbi:MAG: hypothetical protein FJX25_06335 [Alphaproteobacteria bacterium]|nr:hypothetical protein [Alphaproteobacteria bacterium]
MSKTITTFDECFSKAFAEGLSDIKFFVRKGENLTVEELKAEAVAFQCAINNGQAVQVASVD